MAQTTQLLKGTLQGCILLILKKQSVYGYALIKLLDDYGFNDIPKGTVYPLLLSMEKKGLIIGEMQPSEDGPQRKYYRLSEAGIIASEDFETDWHQLQATVNAIIKGEHHEKK